MSTRPTQDVERFENLKRRFESVSDEEERRQVIHELVALYLPYVREQLARPMLNRRERARLDSEDVQQSIGWRVARGLQENRLKLLSEPQFRSLLRLMTRNLLLDRTARRAPLPLSRENDQALDPAAMDSTPSNQAAKEELQRKSWELIQQLLSNEEWDLFRRHHVEELGPTELARQMGISPDAVRMRLRRIEDRLRKHLKEFEGYWGG